MRVARANKIDDNQQEIVKALRSAGALVQPLNACGNGVPDLMVGFNGRLKYCEVKDGKKVLSKQMLTPMQESFFREWDGYCVILRSVEDALRLLGKMSRAEE